MEEDVMPAELTGGRIICGDALAVLRTLPDHSVDSIVADPPCAIAFMGAKWDSNKGGRTQWVQWLSDIMVEARRVIKPGGHALIWALPRTSHWTAWALEDAGWKIRDSIAHLFGSGMPKSHNISLAIDKLHQAERKKVTRIRPDGKLTGYEGATFACDVSQAYDSAPITPEAQRYDGYGTGMKPSHEIWWLARAPLAASTIAENVLTYGTGGLNIDACRVSGHVPSRAQPLGNTGDIYGFKNGTGRNGEMSQPHELGRWPANLLLSHTLFCSEIQCADGCPVLALDEQSGESRSTKTKSVSRLNGILKFNGLNNRPSSNTSIRTTLDEGYHDEGGASRYFQQFHPANDVPFIYCPKASKAERNAGCDALPVKSGSGCYGTETTEGAASRGRKPRHSVEGGDANGMSTHNTHPT